MTPSSEQQLDLFLDSLPQAELPTGFTKTVMSQLPVTNVPAEPIQFQLKGIDFALPMLMTGLILLVSRVAQQDLSAIFQWRQSLPMSTFTTSLLSPEWIPITIFFTLLQLAIFGSFAWYWLDEPLY